MNPIWIFAAMLILPAGLFTFWSAVPRHDYLPMSRRRQKYPPISPLTSATTATTGWLGKLLTGRESRMSEWLSSASIKARPVDFTLIALAGSFVGAAIGMLTFGLLAAIGGFLVIIVVIIVVVQIRGGQRRKKIAKQMIETLSTLSGALRSGQSTSQAIGMVAEESEAPTSEEFARVVNEVLIGYDLTAALDAMARRTGSEDMTWVVRAIAINRDVGGSLADIIDGVAETIQGRIEMRSEVDALAAEGKMSAYVLCALPFVAGGMTLLTSPGYMTPMYTTTLGFMVLGAAGLMLLIGMVWMKASIKVKF